MVGVNEGVKKTVVDVGCAVKPEVALGVPPGRLEAVAPGLLVRAALPFEVGVGVMNRNGVTRPG